MFKYISEELKNELIKSLCKRYDETNRKLQRDFVKMHYEDYEIESMKEELKRIDEIIKTLKEE